MSVKKQESVVIKDDGVNEFVENKTQMALYFSKHWTPL